MLVTGFPAGMFQTNCYVIAHDDATECVVVDPGQDAAEPLRRFLESSALTPTAVLLTHGHLDHTWSAQEICDEHDVAAYIHAADRHMLADPTAGVGPQMGQFIAGMTFAEPRLVEEFADGDVLELAGISFRIDHTPGHTQGSVVLRSRIDSDAGSADLVFTGDTLFADSIGRSDLPGGDGEQLLRSIAGKLLVLDDATTVLPGHGTTTTIGRERAGNPFLVGLGRVACGATIDVASDSGR